MGYGCVSQWVDLHRGSNGKCDCLMCIRKPCFPTTDGRLVIEKVDGVQGNFVSKSAPLAFRLPA